MQKLRTVGTVHGLGFQRAAGVILKNKFQGSFYHLFEKLVAARAPLQNGRGQNQQPQPKNRSACADAWLEKPKQVASRTGSPTQKPASMTLTITM